MCSSQVGSDGRGWVQKRLSSVGLVIGVWAMVPPWIGPRLMGIPVKREVVDHIVPGTVVVALWFLMLLAAQQLRSPEMPGLLAGMAVLLSGFWMLATHAPLVGKAIDGTVPILSVIHHTLPGLAVATLGSVWTIAYWSETSASLV